MIFPKPGGTGRGWGGYACDRRAVPPFLLSSRASHCFGPRSPQAAGHFFVGSCLDPAQTWAPFTREGTRRHGQRRFGRALVLCDRARPPAGLTAQLKPGGRIAVPSVSAISGTPSAAIG